jgi:sugar phosphate isomerase/epimerase
MIEPMNPENASSPSRRNLLGGLGALAAAAAAAKGAPAAASGAVPGGLRLGIASYSLRAYQRGAAITIIRKLGISNVNIKDFHLALTLSPEETRAGAAEFTKAGLNILGCGNVDFKKDDESDFKMKFEYAKNAGMPLIVCAPTAETLPKLEKYVKQYNIKIAVHNHGTEDKIFPNPQSVLKIVKDMDPRVGCCVDIGHTVRTGVDIIETVREVGPRLLDMHTKDLADFSSRDSQVVVGDGKIPIPGLFKELIKMNYQGGVMLEYEIDAENPFPGMQRSFSYMRGVLAGLTA